CRPSERGCRTHVLGVRVVPGQAQRHVRLDRRREVAGADVELAPATVRMLLRADPRGRPLGRLRLPDAEKLPQQEVLGIHRYVCLELALPPACWVLEREEMVAGTEQGTLSIGANIDINRRHEPVYTPPNMRGS